MYFPDSGYVHTLLTSPCMSTPLVGCYDTEWPSKKLAPPNFACYFQNAFTDVFHSTIVRPSKIQSQTKRVATLPCETQSAYNNSSNFGYI